MGKLQRVKKLMSSVKAKQGLLLVVILSFVLSLSLSLAPLPLPQVFRDVFYIGMDGVAYGIELDAVCDGDHDDIQVSGIMTDNIPAGGGEIVLLAGNYDFHDTAARTPININNIKISGSGRATSITTDNVGEAPFDCTGQTGWTFEAFACDDAPAYTKTNGITASTIVNGIWVNSVFTVDLPSPETIVRSVSVVVAAYDATSTEKAQADYICDSSSDETEINAAITAVSAAGGGIVQLTQGNFDTDNSIVVKENVWLRGAGMKQTVITPTSIADDIVRGDGTNADQKWSIKVSDFRIVGTNQTAGSGLDISHGWGTAQISNIQADSCYNYGIYGTNVAPGYLHDPVIKNVVASNNGYDGIHLVNGYGMKIDTIYTHLNGASAVLISNASASDNHCHIYVDPADADVGFRVGLEVQLGNTGGAKETLTIASFATEAANNYRIHFTGTVVGNYTTASTAYITQCGSGLVVGGGGTTTGGGESTFIGINSDMNRGHGVELDGTYKGCSFGPTGYIGENLFNGIYIYGGYHYERVSIVNSYIAENNNCRTRSNITGGETEESTENGTTYGYSGIEIDTDEAGIVIHGCQIGDEAGSTPIYTQYYGIKITQTDSEGIEIFGNHFDGNVGAAILNNCTDDNYIGTINIHDNLGYFGRGEKRTIAVTITAGVENTVTYLQNPFAQAVWITEVYFNLTTVASATNPTYDIKIDTDGSGVPDGTALLDGSPDTAGTYWSWSNVYGGAATGVQTAYVSLASNASTSDWVGICIEDAAGADSAGVFYVTIMGQ